MVLHYVFQHRKYGIIDVFIINMYGSFSTKVCVIHYQWCIEVHDSSSYVFISCCCALWRLLVHSEELFNASSREEKASHSSYSWHAC